MMASIEEPTPSPDIVIQHFPNRKGKIKDFFMHSSTFREICADFAEMVAWLEEYCESEKQPSINCDYARETLKDLETEIIDSLEGHSRVVNDEIKRSMGK